MSLVITLGEGLAVGLGSLLGPDFGWGSAVELNPSLESIGESRSHPIRSRSVSEAELIFDQTKPNIQKATKKLHYYLTLQKKASKNRMKIHLRKRKKSHWSTWANAMKRFSTDKHCAAGIWKLKLVNNGGTLSFKGKRIEGLLVGLPQHRRWNCCLSHILKNRGWGSEQVMLMLDLLCQMFSKGLFSEQHYWASPSA